MDSIFDPSKCPGLPSEGSTKGGTVNVSKHVKETTPANPCVLGGSMPAGKGKSAY